MTWLWIQNERSQNFKVKRNLDGHKKNFGPKLCNKCSTNKPLKEKPVEMGESTDDLLYHQIFSTDFELKTGKRKTSFMICPVLMRSRIRTCHIKVTGMVEISGVDKGGS